jgi:predicted RNase H-like HicB family nuclease
MRKKRLQRQPTIGVNAMRYTVLLHRSDEGISVSVPGLPGCWSEGETEAEALENIRDAIAEYLSAVQDVTGGHEPHEPVTWTSAARPPIC